MKIRQYNRLKAIQYAEKWAYKRNPKYYNFLTTNKLDDIYVATHTDDSYHRKIPSYQYKNIKFLHIEEIGTY